MEIFLVEARQSNGELVSVEGLTLDQAIAQVDKFATEDGTSISRIERDGRRIVAADLTRMRREADSRLRF